MKPNFRIACDDRELARAFDRQLISLTVSDASGVRADEVQIKVDNPGFGLSYIEPGTKLEVALGWGDQLTDMGAYYIDQLDYVGPLRSVSIRAAALNHQAGIVDPVTASYRETQLGKIVEKIAKARGLRPVMDSSLANIAIDHVDQTSESDIAFLSRLARENGGMVSVKGGRLVMTQLAPEQSVSGEPIPAYEITRDRLLGEWTVKVATRGGHTGVKAYYRSPRGGGNVEIEVGHPTRQYVLSYPYADEALARRAAEAQLRAYQRGTRECELTVLGDPELAAEHRFECEGFDAALDGTWVATKVTHELSGSGFQSKVVGQSVSK